MKSSERADPDLDGAHFRKGVEQFNCGEYWHAHESWEAVWLVAEGEQKSFLQGLIQLAAACYHIEKGNTRGASRLLVASLKRLDPLPETCGGIALGELRSAARTLTPEDVGAIRHLTIRPWVS